MSKSDDGQGENKPDAQSGATVQPPTGGDDALAVQVAKLGLSQSVLDVVVEAVSDMGVAGERKLAQIIYLVMTSRILRRPVSLLIKGHSSGGKSFLLKTVLRLFPASSYWLRSGVSPKLLVRTAESFVHRMLVFEEAAGLNRETEYFLRVLLSEGRIIYSTLGQGPGGDWVEQQFEKEGPTGLVLTTTEVGIHAENETRMLSVSISDSAAQTRRALIAAAQSRGNEVDTRVHQAFQEWLGAQSSEVTVPFIRALAEGIAPVAIRIRRDFNLLVSLIEAHALLHQLTRGRDASGAVIATIEDYRAVYLLVADPIGYGVDASVPAELRETVNAVANLVSAYPDGVPAIAVSKELGIDKSTVSRRVKVAIQGGYLINREDSKGKPQRLIVGDPLPEGADVLPHPDALAHGCAVAPNPVIRSPE